MLYLFQSTVLVLTLGLSSTSVTAQPGSFDPVFGDEGKVLYQQQSWDRAHEVIIESNGAVTVFGITEIDLPANRRGLLLRLDPTGNVLAAHDYEGFTFGCVPPRAFYSGMRRDDGQYITVGYRQTTCSGSPRPMEINQIAANGTVTQSFIETEFNGHVSVARALAQQPDGMILVGGYASTLDFDASTYDFALARLEQTGSGLAFDPDFGIDGEVLIDFNGGRDVMYDLEQLADGRIVGAGVAQGPNGWDIALIRLLANGSLDPSFGNTNGGAHGQGTRLFDFHGYDDLAESIAVDTDGRITTAGYSTGPDGQTRRFTVVRFTSEGFLDTTFADNGIALIDFGGPAAWASDVAVDSVGRIYVAGTTETASGGFASRRMAVAMLRPDGSPETMFANDGKLIIEFEPDKFAIGSAMAIDPLAGHIVVAGTSGELVENDTLSKVAVVRLKAFPDILLQDRFEGQ